MILPVEDELSDILSKAQKGLGVSTEALAARSGLAEEKIRALRRGEFERDAAESLANALGLRGEALAALGEGDWRPSEIGRIEGFELAVSPFYDWHVNAFLVWDLETKRAIAFDTGTDATPMVELLQARGLTLEAIMLTHAHRDHVAGLDTLLGHADAKVFISSKEENAPGQADLIGSDFTYRLGQLGISCFDTPGHTTGGMSFVVDGLSRKVAIVGDALFAGSMGGANVSYADGLASVARLLELPGDTVLAPGHGPLTTVAEERQMNCFFGARSTFD